MCSVKAEHCVLETENLTRGKTENLLGPFVRSKPNKILPRIRSPGQYRDPSRIRVCKPRTRPNNFYRELSCVNVRSTGNRELSRGITENDNTEQNLAEHFYRTRFTENQIVPRDFTENCKEYRERSDM